MFKPFADGTIETIQGLPCQVPPKGWIYNPLLIKKGKIVGGMEHIGVHARITQSKHCYWERDPRWEVYKDWRAEELRLQKTNPSFKHPELSRFIEECWRWRLGGMWFSNNGKATYITGNHWFQLSCGWLPENNGYPDFRDTDRQFYYFKEFVWAHPKLFGIVEATKRRQGKSFRAGAIGLYHSSMEKSQRTGMQSKTDDDARDLFKKVIIEPFRALPYFFQPTTNIPQSGKLPGSELEFRTGKMGGRDAELGSIVSYRSSVETAYDGYRMGFYLGDEVGKTVKANVRKRWNIVRRSLLGPKKEIVGKALLTTTVEEMEGGGANFLRIWESSNHYEYEDFITPSGLVKWFLPADHAFHLDRYGMPMVEQSRAEIIAERERTFDEEDLADLKRMEPLDESEMFLSAASACRYNATKITGQVDALKYGINKREIRRGDFVWKDKKDGEVIFSDNPHGRFYMAYDPPPEFRNRVKEISEGIFKPEFDKNGRFFGAGIDPIEHRWTTKSSSGKRSDPAISILKAENVILPSDLEGGEACWYHTRPDLPEDFYEDTIMALRYYGCYATIERQKEGIIRHMYDRGYGAFVTKMHGQDVPGIPAGTAVTNAIMALTQTYIATKIEATYNLRLLGEWLLFDPTNTTAFDCAMAFGNAQLELQGFIADGKFSAPKKKRAPRKVSSILPFR